MRVSLTFANAIAFCLIASALCSCKKEISPTATQSTLSSAAASQETDATTETIYLQPGPAEGQDAFVAAMSKDSGAAFANHGRIPELPIAAWNDDGNITHARTYIKFTKLQDLVPAGATIITARLRLYGLDSSTVLPQGNSVYPGSPYKPDNSCYILRVTEHDWTENKINWVNKPSCSRTQADTIASSTSQWNYDITADVTNLVRNMVGEGKKNYGFCIVLRSEDPNRSVVYASSECADRNKWPVLAIKYRM